MVAFGGRRARDRYYLDDPTEMIAGDIVPPGCYLSAVEILRRQYTARLVEEFLALFPLTDGGADDDRGVSAHAAGELRAYATGGIARALQDA